MVDTKPKRTRAQAAKENGKKGGRPAFEATEDQKSHVTRLKLAGSSNERIAAAIGINVDTLTKHFVYELDLAVDDLNANIAATIYQKAMGGDTAMLALWAKTRMGWRETERKEITGADGKALFLPCIALEFVDAEDGKPKA